MNYVDGNALAGPLLELFRVDMTTAEGRCSGCRRVQLLARAVVYISQIGSVMRCRDCGIVQAVLVETGGAISLRLPGVALTRLPEDR
jgi:hypothetical protein